VAEGRGSRVIDAHDDVLDPQSSLVSNAALGHLSLEHVDMVRFRCGYHLDPVRSEIRMPVG